MKKDIAILNKGDNRYTVRRNVVFDTKNQFEYGDNWRFAGSSLIHCIEFLEKYNYQVFLIRPDGLYKLDYPKWKELYSFANFFACRKSEFPAIQTMIKGVF